MEKKRRPVIDIPVLVEGKYDKIKLESIIDAAIITTEGFGIFKNAEKIHLIRKLAEKNGIIIITDSDGAGLVIRNYINSVLPKEKIIHLYIPMIVGKEKRKKIPSKSGFVGVEGVESEKIRRIFEPFSDGANYPRSDKKITKNDFYSDGLSGTDNSACKRGKLIEKLGFPSNMSANALLEAVNLLFSYDEYKKIIEEL